MSSSKQPSQMDLIFSYYQERPGRAIEHPEVVDWAVREWRRRTGKVFRDPDRAIRRLHEIGRLQKLDTGVYRYDPDLDTEYLPNEFSAEQKAYVLHRDDYKCVDCGAGPASGTNLHVDHIKPRSKGGRATIGNGQTLCSTHNNRKKDHGQTETGKKMFMRMLDVARASGDEELVAFIVEVLRIYDAHGINSHVVWRDDPRQGTLDVPRSAD